MPRCPRRTAFGTARASSAPSATAGGTCASSSWPRRTSCSSCPGWCSPRSGSPRSWLVHLPGGRGARIGPLAAGLRGHDPAGDRRQCAAVLGMIAKLHRHAAGCARRTDGSASTAAVFRLERVLASPAMVMVAGLVLDLWPVRHLGDRRAAGDGPAAGGDGPEPPHRGRELGMAGFLVVTIDDHVSDRHAARARSASPSSTTPCTRTFTGGAERRFHELASRLADRHEVHFVSWQFWEARPTISRDGVDVPRRGPPPGSTAATASAPSREAARSPPASVPMLAARRVRRHRLLGDAVRPAAMRVARRADEAGADGRDLARVLGRSLGRVPAPPPARRPDGAPPGGWRSGSRRPSGGGARRLPPTG